MSALLRSYYRSPAICFPAKSGLKISWVDKPEIGGNMDGVNTLKNTQTDINVLYTNCILQYMYVGVYCICITYILKINRKI